MKTAILSTLLLSALAHATPADLFILIDTSGSMARPLGTGDARLTLAKQTARDIIAAVQNDHRVGLARYAQLERVLPGGEGKRAVLGEDPLQCDHGSNLLAGMDVAGANEALRWLDGVEALGNPELVPMGDSPLVRGVEVAVQYIRNKRRADPLRHCVNAVLIVITDGLDTCVGGSELRGTLADLATKASREDIRTLVLSYTPDAEAAKAVAKIGNADGVPFTDSAQLLAAVRNITGRLAPEACLASGVEPSKLGIVPTEADAGVTCTPAAPTGCGCGSTETSGIIALTAVLVVASARRRRWLLVSVFALGLGCAQTKPTCTTDAGTPVATLKEPAAVRDEALARVPLLVAGAEAVRRDVFDPLLVPEKAFAKVSDTDGCLALVRGIGFEPYVGVQRGAAGCLSTRRCNSFDKALLFKACLDAKGVSAELQVCNDTPPSMRALLLAEAKKPLVLPDLSAATAKEREVALQLFGDPAIVARLDTATAGRDEAVKQFFSTAIAGDVSTLLPLANLDATATDTEATARANVGLERYGFVKVGTRNLDPTLAGSAVELGSCADGPFVPATEAITLKAEVVLHYVGGAGAWKRPELIAATLSVKPYEVFGQHLTMALAEANVSTLGFAVPAVSTTGCLRAFLEVGSTKVRGEPFHIGPQDSTSCPATSLSPDEPGRRLSKVTLRLTTNIANTETVIDRVLVDRYGYAASETAAEATGPMYSDGTARRLLPMRADILLLSGLPSPGALRDVAAREAILRRADFEAQLAQLAGMPAAVPPPGPPSALPFAILGAVTHFSPPELGTGLALVVERPWMLSQVRRRGFGVSGAALDLVDQTIVDVLDAPLLVVRADNTTAPSARLRAQVAMAALVTEAETVAARINGLDGVVSAATMLRDPSLAGRWAAMDPQNLDHSLFPDAVVEAASAYSGQVVVATPGAVKSDAADPIIAWWRFDKRTGQGLGELRFEGTFYGGVPGMLATAKLLVDLDKCLYAGASAALMGGEECDLRPCFKAAFDYYKQALATEFAGGALVAYAGYAHWSHSLVEVMEYSWEVFGEAVRAWLHGREAVTCG